jgi:hypothetical protein
MKRLHKEKYVGEIQENKIIISPTIYIKIPSSYPFTCPTMYVNEVDHVNVLTKQYSKYKTFITTYKKPIVCFCCGTLACNWSPCNTCYDLYHEYVNYNNQLKQIAAMKTFATSSTLDHFIIIHILQFL